MQNYEKKLRQLIRESINLLLNEVADEFSFAGKDYMFYDKDAIPFFYYMNKLYIGKLRETHWGLIDGQLADKIEELIKKFKKNNIALDPDDSLKEVAWNTVRSNIMTETKYNGRVWLDSKTIAFWRLPSEKKLIKLIKELNAHYKLKGINIDGSWRIFTQDENGNDNMIPLKDFTHGKLSSEGEKINIEKWKQHMMSPIEKEKQGLKMTPKGWGSTHKDYLGHRKIDWALGRAEAYEAGLQEITKPKIAPNAEDLEGNKSIGMNMLIDEVSNFKSSEELLRNGGFSNDALDLAAFGFTPESVKQLMPQQLKIKWEQDLAQAKFEQDEYHRRGMSKIDWAKKINLSEPIEVSFDGDHFFLEDGHHRYVAAKTLNVPLNVELKIKANPIVKLSDKDYDDFHREFFEKYKII